MFLRVFFEKLFKIREKSSNSYFNKKVGDDEGYDSQEKPFLDHLEDFRKTVIKIAITLSISTFLCFLFHDQIFYLIKIPIKMPLASLPDGISLWDRLDLVTLGPPESIILMLKLSFFCALIITFPFVLYFIFEFVFPGLKQHEKKLIIPGTMAGFVLFLVGVSFAFFLATPIALKFFYQFETKLLSLKSTSYLDKSINSVSLLGVNGQEYLPLSGKNNKNESKIKSSLDEKTKEDIQKFILNSFATIKGDNILLKYDKQRDKVVVVTSKDKKTIYRIGEYISFISRLMLVFGISFQMPVIVFILVKLGLLTSLVMKSTRIYAWVIILISSAILTPPDVITLSLLGVPLIILYEICIVVASLIEKKHEEIDNYNNDLDDDYMPKDIEEIYLKSREDMTDEELAKIEEFEKIQYDKEHGFSEEEKNSYYNGEEFYHSININIDSKDHLMETLDLSEDQINKIIDKRPFYDINEIQDLLYLSDEESSELMDKIVF